MRSRRSVTFGAALALALTGTVAVSASPAGAVESAPAVIPADCSRDVTADLTAWFASVPDNSVLSFAPNGCYRVDGTLVVAQRSGLTFEGNNATFKQITNGSELINPKKVRTRNVWTFGTSTNLVVRNLTTVGANPHAGRGELAYQPKFEAQHAYFIQGVNGMVMDNANAYDVYGDFVALGGSVSNFTMRNSSFARNGRQGWSINGTNIVFENNSITETRRATIDMEPPLPTFASKNVYIRNNDVGPGRLFFFSSVGAAAPMDNINITGNRLHKKGLVIFVAPPKGTRSNFHVVGNVSDGGVSGFGSAMVFKNIEGLEVRANIVPTQWSHHLSGVSVSRSSHVSITTNTFRGATAALRDRGDNTDIAQSNNLVGPLPMGVQPTTRAGGPTPKPPLT